MTHWIRPPKHPIERAALSLLWKHREHDWFVDPDSDPLQSLTPREERILRAAWGIDQPACRTLADVGRQFAVTSERIHQIIQKACIKLLHQAVLAEATLEAREMIAATIHQSWPPTLDQFRQTVMFVPWDEEAIR